MINETLIERIKQITISKLGSAVFDEFKPDGAQKVNY